MSFASFVYSVSYYYYNLVVVVVVVVVALVVVVRVALYRFARAQRGCRIAALGGKTSVTTHVSNPNPDPRVPHPRAKWTKRA